jgi:hypothetical protein
LRLVDLISTGEIKLTGGIKITSMVLKLPCEFGIWSLNSKSSGRNLLGTHIPTIYIICQWNKITSCHGISPSLMWTTLQPYCKLTQMEHFAFKLAQSPTHLTFVSLALIKWLQTPFMGESATCDKAEEIDELIICSTESVLVNMIQLFSHKVSQ